MKKLVLISLFAVVALAASAQTRINALVDKLEKSDAGDLTYVEKRDPATHAITLTQFIFTIPQTDVNQILSAINADRDQSVSYSVVGNKMYRIKFDDGNFTTSVLFVIDRPSISNEAFMAGVPYDVKGDNVLVVKREKINKK